MVGAAINEELPVDIVNEQHKLDEGKLVAPSTVPTKKSSAILNCKEQAQVNIPLY